MTLSNIIWLPLLTGLLTINCKGPRLTLIAKYTAVTVAVITFGLTLQLYFSFNTNTWEMQFVERLDWLPSIGISYAIGVDGISLPLVMLTAFMSLCVVLFALTSRREHLIQYISLFMIMQGLMHGVFLALDSILFYIFFEAMMIPMFILIGMWGGSNRKYATIKFILYTFLGSLFLLIAFLYLHLVATKYGLAGADSYAIANFYNLPLSLTAQKVLFWGMLVAFAVKVPMWPVHTWLPDAHTEAPTGGSVILAAITLKMGGYGLVRFVLPIAPTASLIYAPVITVLSLIAITYIALVAIAQQDMKRLIAYSSISHMGFVTLGIFLIFDIYKTTANYADLVTSMQGALTQMISHGFISGALFFCIGVLYHRTKSREINDYGGVVNTMPTFAAFMMLFSMANCGLPGTSGFVGEFLVITSSLKANFWIAAIAATTLIFGATYTLWMYKRVIFGAADKQMVVLLEDVNFTERTILFLLAIMVLGLGLWPAPLFNVMDSSILHLVTHVIQANG